MSAAPQRRKVASREVCSAALLAAIMSSALAWSACAQLAPSHDSLLVIIYSMQAPNEGFWITWSFEWQAAPSL